MGLASVPSTDPGGLSPGGADLVVKYDDMGKIGHAAFLLHRHLSSAGKHAQDQTEAAAKSLESDGFETGAALAKAGKGWQGQLQVLLDACAQISNHLDYSVKSSKQDDGFIAARMKASKISEYLDVPPPTSGSDAPHIPKADGPIM
ncbi:hypothetical protein [Streptomyces aureus]|uniref:Uncharacterized protein n=1 Tax=Streptomyces aureus TaxID=193461 RepID=A0ABV4T0L4_9ACTN